MCSESGSASSSVSPLESVATTKWPASRSVLRPETRSKFRRDCNANDAPALARIAFELHRSAVPFRGSDGVEPSRSGCPSNSPQIAGVLDSVDYHHVRHCARESTSVSFTVATASIPCGDPLSAIRSSTSFSTSKHDTSDSSKRSRIPSWSAL